MTEERQQEAEEQAEAAPATPSGPEPPPGDLEGWRARLKDEQEKAQAYLSNWQRAAADHQNFRRRVEQERSEVGRLANASFVINLLPLVDDLERALRTVDTRLVGLTWIDGIWLIYRKFQAVLEHAGVQEIAAEGLAFDPNVHEAVSEAPGDEGSVVSVVQKGYRLGDRVVRPAMVIVGKREAGDETREAGGETRDAGGQKEGQETRGDLTP